MQPFTFNFDTPAFQNLEYDLKLTDHPRRRNNLETRYSFKSKDVEMEDVVLSTMQMHPTEKNIFYAIILRIFDHIPNQIVGLKLNRTTNLYESEFNVHVNFTQIMTNSIQYFNLTNDRYVIHYEKQYSILDYVRYKIAISPV